MSIRNNLSEISQQQGTDSIQHISSLQADSNSSSQAIPSFYDKQMFINTSTRAMSSVYA
jgi:hypothetical protein